MLDPQLEDLGCVDRIFAEQSMAFGISFSWEIGVENGCRVNYIFSCISADLSDDFSSFAKFVILISSIHYCCSFLHYSPLLPVRFCLLNERYSVRVVGQCMS